jgi:serine/threonine protein kinase
MIGRNLRHFQILETLGEGGMGIVYKARDTHLDRLVAIKVLPADKVSDPERRRRFVQEAKAASALNHPNIITIHDIDSDGDVTYMVMEYVPGQTLGQWIRSHKRNLSDTLRYAVQIADALTAAHGAGIIHRDLKPGNVMIAGAEDRPGSVKVLDFGLAKLVEPSSPGEATVTVAAGERPKTTEGTIVGTAAYMSPEQAEGKVTDHRSDIFSFGSMLYEMLTGRRPFHGETTISTLSAILRVEPKPVSEIVPNLPHELERIVGRCLRKDPGKRFQHADDLRIALEELKEESESGRLTPVHTGAAARSSRWSIYAMGILLLVAAAGAAWWTMRTPASKNLSGSVLKQLTFDPGLTTDPTFWPEGKLIAYASDRTGGNLDLWVQQLDSGEARRLTTNEADDREPNFSPDGSRIAFRSEREGGGIWVVSTIGGQERKIANNGHHPRFSPDGQWIAYWIGTPDERRFTGPTEIHVVPSTGGPARRLVPDFPGARNPVWSPDGKRLMFWGGNGVSGVDWWVVPLDSGPPVRTGAAKALAEQKIRYWAPSAWVGDRVYFSAALGDSTNLWQVTLNPRTFLVSGTAERLTSGSGLELYAAVSGKQAVFASLNENIDIWSLPIDTNQAKVLGEPRRITEELAPNVNSSISHDGTRVVFASARMGKTDVVVRDLAGGQETVLASAADIGPYPRISGDGSQVAYSAGPNRKLTTYVVAARGGVARKVCDECQLRTWAHNGNRLVITAANGDNGFLDVATGAREIFLPGDQAAPRTSWDDRWIAFYSPTAEGRTRMWIAPVRTPGLVEKREWIPISDGSSWEVVPEFSPDGKLLYFISQRDGFRCQWAQRLDAATKKPLGTPFAIHHHHRARLSPAYAQFGTVANSVARDKIAFTMGERTGNIWLATSRE